MYSSNVNKKKSELDPSITHSYNGRSSSSTYSSQPGYTQNNTVLVLSGNNGGDRKDPGPFARLSFSQKALLVASWFTGVGLLCWLAYCLYDYATRKSGESPRDENDVNKGTINSQKNSEESLNRPLLPGNQVPVVPQGNKVGLSTNNTVQLEITQRQEQKEQKNPLVQTSSPTINTTNTENSVNSHEESSIEDSDELKEAPLQQINEGCRIAQEIERQQLKEFQTQKDTNNNEQVFELDCTYMTDQQVNELLKNQILGNSISTNNIVSDPRNYLLDNNLWCETDGSGPNLNDPTSEQQLQINLNEENDTEVQNLLLKQCQEETVKKKQELKEKQKNGRTRTELCLKMNEETSTWEVVPEKKELSLEIYKELEEKQPVSASVAKIAEEVARKINTGQKVQFSLGNALYSYQKVTNKLSGVSHIEETKRLKDDGDDDGDVVTARRIGPNELLEEVTKLLQEVLTAHSTDDPLTAKTNEKASVDSVKEPVTKKPQRRKYFETTQDEKGGTLQRLRGEALLEKRKFYAGNTLIIPEQRDKEIAKDAAAWIKSYVEGGQTVEIRLSDAAFRYRKPLEDFPKVLEQQETELGRELIWTPTHTIDDVEHLEQHITQKLFDYLQKNPENSAPLPLEKKDKTAPKGNQKEESSEQPTPPKTPTPEELRKKRLKLLGL